MSITRPVTLAVPLARISVGERLRQVDPDFVALVAASMAEQGQITPIEVGLEDGDGVHPLIAGAHRLEAARALGWDHIEARVFDGDALAMAMREVDENLCRHELSDLDRAAFLARRKVLWEEIHPEARHGGKRKKGQVATLGHLTRRFSAEAAEKVGLSERTIRRLVQRHDALHPEVRRALAGTAIARNGGDLDALAKMSHAAQLRVLEVIQSRGVSRVGAAIEVLRGPAPEQDIVEKMFLRYLKIWDAAPLALKKRIEVHARIEIMKAKGDAA